MDRRLEYPKKGPRARVTAEGPGASASGPSPSRVDFAASSGVYLEHLAPIWAELEHDLRGVFYVEPWLRPRAVELVDEQHLADFPQALPETGTLVVVAGHPDYLRSPARPVVLAEHGAGQSYSSRHTNYAGGEGRSRAVLFLVPNEQAARRNHKRYPTTPNLLTGPSYLDPWHRGERARVPTGSDRRIACISFHWRCDAAPEAGTALVFYRGALKRAREELEEHGVELIGHGHPRIREALEPLYRRAGIRFVDRFETVLETADVYVVDNSSTLFEFAALDRPVVLLNSPKWRRRARHGLRFWDEATVGIQVDTADELVPAVLRALEDPPEVAALRRASIARVYPVRDGSSARRAAEGIAAVTRGNCLVCNARDCRCGPTTTSKAVDIIEPEDRTLKTGPKKLYPNPATGGRSFLKLSTGEAIRRGLAGKEVKKVGLISTTFGTYQEKVESLTDRLAANGATVEEILEAREAFLDPAPELAAEAAEALERIVAFSDGELVEHLETLRARAAEELADEADRMGEASSVDEGDASPPAQDDTAPPTKKRGAPNKKRDAPEPVVSTGRRRPKASADG